MRFISFIIAIILLMPTMVSAIAATPALIELSLDRGESVEETISVINAHASERTYYVGTVSFEAGQEDGTPQFFSESTNPDRLENWISFDSNQFIVPANSRAEIPFKVNVPNDIPSGGYYGAVTISPAPADIVATNGAIIEAKTAVLVLVTVEGETTQQAELLDLTIDGPAWSSMTQGTAQYRVQNQGNTHVLPEGELVLKDIFGRTLAIHEANTSNGRVLPGSTRTYTVDISKETGAFFERVKQQMQHVIIGPVEAELTLDVAQKSHTESVKVGFIVPWEALITIIGGVVLLLGVYKLGARKKH